MLSRSAFFIAFLMVPQLSHAASPLGVWSRDAGRTQVAITRCGPALCGRVTRLLPGSRARVGQLVLFDMKPSGPASWAGNALNPEDGNRYSGKMTLAGDRLVVSGCVLAGLVCNDVAWTRAR